MKVPSKKRSLLLFTLLSSAFSLMATEKSSETYQIVKFYRQMEWQGPDFTVESYFEGYEPVIAEADKPDENTNADGSEKNPDIAPGNANGANKDEKNGDTKKKKLNCENCMTSDQELLKGMIEDLKTQVAELEDKVADLEDSQDSFADQIEAVENAPSEDLLAKTNFLLAGTAYTFFTAPAHANSTFGTVIDPVFLWRYGDNFLFEMKLDIQLSKCNTNIALIYATADYILCNEIIVRAGKFSLPLGLVWEKMTTGWINKLPNLPPPYNPRALALTPAADVGVDIRGAFEAGYWFGWGCEEGIPAVIAYDVWVGNGPEEADNGDIELDCAYGDNNYNKSFGSRIGLRPQPFREIGFSAMRAQWNNNHLAGIISSRKRLYYDAFAIDLNWRLTEISKLMGEYIWTGRQTTKNARLHIHKGRIFQTGWWLQYSRFLNELEGTFCLGCKDHPFWSNLEFVTRAGQVDSDIRGLSGRQLSFGLNYFIENTLILKGAYDINQGRRLGGNRVTFQLACAY